MEKMRTEHQSGLTLVEIVVVLSIIVFISLIGLRFYDEYKVTSRDRGRMFIMSRLSTAIEQYKNDRGHYPAAGGQDPGVFVYRQPTCDGTDWNGFVGNTGADGYGVRFDTSGSGMILQLWREGYINELFTDPLNSWGSSLTKYNCRYVIAMTSKNETELPLPTELGGSNPCSRYPRCCPGGGSCSNPVLCSSYSCSSADVQLASRWPHPDTYSEIQKYALHCTLERPSEISSADNGSPTAAGAEMVELYVPNRWMCIASV